MEGESQLPNAPFPAPPPFWQDFTLENQSRFDKWKEEEVGSEKDRDIPQELANLEPPPIPKGNYTIFGEEQTQSNELPTLSSRGVTQLYPDEKNIDHPRYLLQIVRSLHLNFQELNIILAQNPSLKDAKLEDIKDLFQNANWLVNMYRPHQARENLIAMMEEQIVAGRGELEECDRLKGKVGEMMTQIKKGGGGMIEEEKRVDPSKRVDREELKSQQLWEKIMEINVEDG